LIYIITALKAEATPLIGHLKLEKIRSKPFEIYSNQNIILIISGIGNINIAIATTYLLSTFQTAKSDKIYNIGICGSKSTNNDIGELYTIKKIVNQSTNKVVHITNNSDTREESITTTPIAQNSSHKIKTNLVDMESFGFYSSAKLFLPKESIMIIKIVSDKVDDTILGKNIIYSLLENKIEEIKSLMLL
jgi:nucleoside phosphorylase